MDVVKKGVKPEELIGMEIREKSFTSTALASNASFSGDVKYKAEQYPKELNVEVVFRGVSLMRRRFSLKRIRL